MTVALAPRPGHPAPARRSDVSHTRGTRPGTGVSPPRPGTPGRIEPASSGSCTLDAQGLSVRGGLIQIGHVHRVPDSVLTWANHGAPLPRDASRNIHPATEIGL